MRAQATRDAAGLWVRARHDVTRRFAGAYRSAFRGQGLVFEELRDYMAGDDAQWIEWKATARLARPILKQMREEREGCVALLVDVSNSGIPGASGRSRRPAILRAASALAVAAARVGDPIAVARFGDARMATWAPGQGPGHLSRVFAAFGAFEGGAASDLAPPLLWATDRLPQHSIVIVLSDGYCPDPGPVVARCARKHELIVLWVDDPIDARSPRSAPARVFGAEGGSPGLWRAGQAPARLPLEVLRRRGADTGVLHTETVIPDLRRFFRRRAGLA